MGIRYVQCDVPAVWLFLAQRGYHFSRIVERLCENQAPPSAIDHGMTVHVWPVPGGCTTVQTKRVLALKAKT
jgi:hypothetical protein